MRRVRVSAVRAEYIAALFHISSAACAQKIRVRARELRTSVNSAFLITCLISCVRKRVRNLIELNEVRDGVMCSCVCVRYRAPHPPRTLIQVRCDRERSAESGW